VSTRLPESDDEDLPAGEVLPVFDPKKFERWCGRLRIDSKEMGRIPLTWLGSQRYFIEQVAAGLAEGVHTFVVLKGRQMGISTICLALDLYWSLKYQGLQGGVVTDTDENREVFRSHIRLLIEGLRPKARRQVRTHNRVQLMLRNASRLQYMVAGTKKNGELGRAKSANFLHATECSSWGDEEGLGSLVNTLAQKNPQRLYIFESTARGYDMFYTMWETAKESSTQKAIFIGWWRNELYSWPEDSVEYKTFWDGQLTNDEAEWVKEVFESYHTEITAEQIAWWRWYVTDQMKGDETLALQEMPPTEQYAFQLSGSKFFKSEHVNAAFSAARERECLYFRYVFGKEFEDTQFIETTKDLAEVLLWQTPVKADQPGFTAGTYAMGADPAYGSSEWADWHAGCLYRCYADRIVQVAEAGSPDWTEVQFAWVLAHLCGWYGNVMLNLEMQGPGGAVYNELGNLKRRAGSLPAGDPRLGPFAVVSCIRDYLWKRQDTMFGSYAYQWQTTSREKVRLMTQFRGNFDRGLIELRSPRAIQQLRNVRREADQIGGEGRAKDDFVLAAAIGHIAWNDWLMLELQTRGETYAKAHQPQRPGLVWTPLERSVVGFLRREGIAFRGLTQ
jgi:hypothetical protein